MCIGASQVCWRGLRSLYIRPAGCATDGDAAEELVTRMDASLTIHPKEIGVIFIQFAFRWMNCLLLRKFKLESIIQFWDTYLSEEGGGF